jgi:sortase A
MRGRLARVISWVLLAGGALLLTDAGLTLVWQEPVTAVLALIRRDGVDRRYLSLRALALDQLDRQRLAQARTERGEIAYLAARDARRVPEGAAIGRIVIPRLGASYLVMQGTGSASLEAGPGHYTSTAFPGQGRTVAIAGHRTTYLAPFRELDRLRPDDRIDVLMPYGRFVYAVTGRRVVSPEAWWITRSVGYERLVLSACAPLFSAAQRLVVFARLVSETPVRFVLTA